MNTMRDDYARLDFRVTLTFRKFQDDAREVTRDVRAMDVADARRKALTAYLIEHDDADFTSVELSAHVVV